MATPAPPETSRPYGLFMLMAVAGVLYVLMLGNALHTTAGGGESSIAAAFEALFVTAGLWIALAAITIAGGIMGTMPRWARWSAVLLIPVSGIAAFVAIDMCSRHMRWAAVFPALPPLIIAFYAYWARSPWLHNSLPPQQTSALAWGAVLILSILPMTLAAFY